MRQPMPMPDSVSGMTRDARPPESSGAAMNAALSKPTAPPDDDSQPASPEEQRIYEKFVMKSAEVMRGDPKKMAEIIEEAGDPAVGASRVAGAAAQRVLAAAAKADQEIPTDVVIHATEELFNLAADIAARAGLGDLDDDQHARGMFLAFDEMRMAMDSVGMLDREAAAEELEQVKRNPEALERMATGGSRRPPGTGLAPEAAPPDPSRPAPEAGGRSAPRAPA